MDAKPSFASADTTFKLLPEQGTHMRPEVAVTEAVWKLRKRTGGLEEGHHARIAETQRRDALAVDEGGLLKAIEGFLGQDTMMAEAFDFEQLTVDTVAQVAQVGEVIDPLAYVEVLGVVDGGLGGQGVFFFEVLLDVGGLVLDVQAG